MLRNLSLFCLPLLACTACIFQNDDDSASMETEPDCGEFVQIVDELPEAADLPSEIQASVDSLCLTITLGYSGCSSDQWTMDLFTTGIIAESLPTQSSVSFVFNDAEPGEDQLCLAYFTKSFTFDLSPYLEGALPTHLHISGTDIVLLIE